ncbi:MAG: M1 family metallopeptidase [Candidatus Aenigmatarchaeota archaeon]
MKTESFRLPENVRPINYKLFFEVDLKKFKFSGKEIIYLNILKPTSKIILNARDLEIKNAFLSYDKKSIKTKVRLENEKELLKLTFNKYIKGQVKLYLEFIGKLTDSLVGFYRSKYFLNKRKKFLATTQFEAPYARRCFPCFDEPQYKSTFNVTIKIDKNLKAISNMPIKEEHIERNKKIVKFYRTPRMSTYLLYIGVGDFEFLEDKLGKTTIRIVTTPGKRNQGRFALELTKKFLSYFQEYSGIAYPLPKLDMIALPDFAAGAMENWGAITFREIYLLFDPKMTSTTIKKRIAMIIAHELWHMWSGDLVTMKWWNDLWLNESFATFMAYKAVDHFFPEWNMWEDFINDETERAFTDDCLKSTHPIEVEVKNPNQIEEIFDAISYSKGGSILRMLEGYMGEELFRKGVSKYLSDNKYGNATSEDLWNSLSKVSDKPIKKIAESWIKQPGYPLVESELKDGKLILKQKRFVPDYIDNKQWYIPLIIKTNDKLLVELLDKPKKELPLGSSEWFKINYGQIGFYRVKYPDENLSKLKFLISSKTLPPLDRWGIQNDLFELSVNGDVDLDKYLDFVRTFYNEDNYLVLRDIYQNIRNIYFVYSQEQFWNSIWSKLKNYHKETFQKILERLGWEPKKDESQKDTLLRELAIRYLAFIEDAEVLRKGKEKFEYYLKTRKLHPDVKSPIFYMMAANGDEKIYKTLLELYLKTKSPEEKRILLIALSQFKNPEILKKFLNFSLSQKVRTQDLVIVFSSVASNPRSRTVLLPWLKKNWKKIKTYEKSGKLFVNLLEAFIAAHVGKENEIKQFFAFHPVKYKMTLERAFEKLHRISSWAERNKEVLIRYFG